MEVKQLRLGAKDNDIITWLEDKSFSSYVKALIREDMKDHNQEIKQELQEIKELIKNIQVVQAPKEVVEEVSATREEPRKSKSKKAMNFIV